MYGWTTGRINKVKGLFHEKEEVHLHRGHAGRVEEVTDSDDQGQHEEPGRATGNVSEWHGRRLVDRNGEKIGTLQDVYVDVDSDEFQFATVKEDVIGRQLTCVPLAGVQIGPDDLQVLVTKEAVRTAPDIELHGEAMSQADE